MGINKGRVLSYIPRFTHMLSGAASQPRGDRLYSASVGGTGGCRADLSLRYRHLVEVRSCSTKQLLDEDDHLVLLDRAGLSLVEGTEDLIERILRELVSGSEVAESVLHELLGLFLVKFTGLVDIVGVPDLVADALDRLLLRGCHYFLG